MRSQLFVYFPTRWQRRSLGTKILLPFVGLMLVALVGSTLAFLMGTARTQEQLMAQQVAGDLAHVRAALESRAQEVGTVATLLSNDPTVNAALQADSPAMLSALNERAVVVRDRFDLDLVQIYNREGEARTNLVISSLYRQSSLLDLVQGRRPHIYVIEEQVLLLHRVPLMGERGTVIVGVDMAAELNRLVAQNRLAVDLGMVAGGVRIGTRENLPFDQHEQGSQDTYSWRGAVTVGGSSADLLLTRATEPVAHVVRAGLLVMVGGMGLTTLLLVGAAGVAARAITRPVRRLATAAEALATGDLSQRVTMDRAPFAIGQEDELGRLAHSFNHMAHELGDLYATLENKVEARTRQLAATAELARTTSASLDIAEVLHASVTLIRERFGFYHVSIFVIEDENVAVLRESSSDAGEVLKSQRHQLAVGSKSLVGAATAAHEPRIVQDVTADPTYYPNPALPATRAEAVFPLLRGGAVLGALDVQSTTTHAFTPDMVALLTTLADQVAVALHNAQLYTKEHESLLRLAEVDRLKTQFIANMSHELRTPLNSIIGFSKVLLKGIDGPLNELQMNDLTLIHKSGRHLLDLINEVLDISKIEAGKMELDFEPVRLAELLRHALATAVPLAEEKKLRLIPAWERELPLVYADNTRLHQVLLNLLSNAVKFTEKGTITLGARSTEALDPRTGEVAPFVEISVRDTGIGIAPEDMSKLFKAFSQVDDSATRKVGGTGLGLAISRSIVEMHGGRIWVNSEVGKGTTLTFVLPVQPPPTQAPPENQEALLYAL